MIDRMFQVLTIGSALGAGVMAGLFFVFSVCIMTALNRLPAEQGVAAMQSINVSILNPLFGLVFGGTAVASAILAIAAPFRWQECGSPWALAGSILYLVGAVVVTMVFNVPRNDALAALDPNVAAASGQWADYVSGWTVRNHVRTVLSVAAALCLMLSLR